MFKLLNDEYLNSHGTFGLITKVRKNAKIRNQYNQVPHLTKDTTWESDKKHKKTFHTSEPSG